MRRFSRLSRRRRWAISGFCGLAAALAVISLAWACTVLVGHRAALDPPESSCVDDNPDVVTGNEVYSCSRVTMTVSGHTVSGVAPGTVFTDDVRQNIANPGLVVPNVISDPVGACSSTQPSIGQITYVATVPDPGMGGGHAVAPGEGVVTPQVASDSVHPANSVRIYSLCADPLNSDTNVLLPIAKIGD